MSDPKVKDNGGKKSSQEEMLRSIMSDITEKLTEDLRDTLAKALEHQITKALTQSLLESEVYRRISKDMRKGLQRIYKEISATAVAKQEPDAQASAKAEQANKLFHEASGQLSTVLEQTEKATAEILDIIDKQTNMQMESEQLIQNLKEGKGGEMALARLAEISTSLGTDLNNIMLSLSFQDLTGQRIKRAVAALKEIESTVIDIYVSTGLLLQTYEQDTTKSIEEIQAETNRKISDYKDSGQSVLTSALKGPSTGSSQKDVDALLSQLGM